MLPRLKENVGPTYINVAIVPHSYSESSVWQDSCFCAKVVEGEALAGCADRLGAQMVQKCVDSRIAGWNPTTMRQESLIFRLFMTKY